MKKYRVVVSYAGAIDTEIEAENSDEAGELVKEKFNDMLDEEFYKKLDVQYVETNVEEIR